MYFRHWLSDIWPVRKCKRNFVGIDFREITQCGDALEMHQGECSAGCSYVLGHNKLYRSPEHAFIGGFDRINELWRGACQRDQVLESQSSRQVRVGDRTVIRFFS